MTDHIVEPVEDEALGFEVSDAALEAAGANDFDLVVRGPSWIGTSSWGCCH